MIQKTSFALLLLMTFSLACTCTTANAQDSLQTRKKAVFILPLIYYTPETRWVFGVGGATNFNLGETDDTYESQAASGIAYTLRNQFLSFASWRVFSPENKNLFSGEVGWYDYVYFFYGIGNQINESDSETYDARFPRLRWDYFRRISGSTYLGVKTGLDNFQFSGFNPDGKLANEPFVGSEGGLNFGIGPALILDSRDDSIYPVSGWYSENYIQRFGQPWGGDFSYWEVGLDIRNYQTIRPGLVLANQFATKITSGTTPFFALPLLGGNRSLRGLFEGKYRDSNSAFIQSELRKSLGDRWGIVGFAGLGNVFPDFKSLAQNTKVTYGAGGRFRLSKAKKLNLRLDLAHSSGESFQFYFTFGEAF